jgi:hypothetical protein
LLALISVVADYTNNELIPKGVNLEKHVQWLQCIMSKKLPMYMRIGLLPRRLGMERPWTPTRWTGMNKAADDTRMNCWLAAEMDTIATPAIARHSFFQIYGPVANS